MVSTLVEKGDGPGVQAGPWLQSQLPYPPSATLRDDLVDKMVFSGAGAGVQRAGVLPEAS